MFSDMQLRYIHSILRRLPFPIAISLEALGNFSLDAQPIVPVFASYAKPELSPALNYAPNQLRGFFTHLRQPVPITNEVYALARNIEDLPVVTWNENFEVQAVRASDETLAFWITLDPIPPASREIFYYSNSIKVSEYDEVLSGALMYGLEEEIVPFSRLSLL